MNNKKIFMLLLIFLMVFGLVSCSSESDQTIPNLESTVEIMTEGDVRQIDMADASTLTVTLTYPNADDNLVIRYTTDGSAVSEESTEYTTPFPISADVTVRARAFESGYDSSDTSEKKYYKITEVYSDKTSLRAALENHLNGDLGPNGDYNHIGLDASLTDLSRLFNSLDTFNGDISAWNVSAVTNMYWMFFYAESFNQSLNDWNVSSVTHMGYMFTNATSFNQPLNDWDVSSVTDMGGMFANAPSFNQPLNDWDVSSVTVMGGMFANAPSFNQPLNDWDVSSVTNMNSLFVNATSFNQPLNDWDVSSVTQMGVMFKDADAFDQPLNNWNVSSVTHMGDMFKDTDVFDQDLTNWENSLPTTPIDYTDIIEGSTYMTADNLPPKLGGTVH